VFAFASDVFRRYRASDFIFAQGTASGNRVEIDTNLSGCNICIIEIGLWGSVGWIWDFWGAWHSVVVLERSSILEAKDGAYGK